MLYRQISQFDRVNHSAGMNFSYKLTRRVSLALHDNVSYQNGVYPSLTNQEILAGPAAPISLDQIVVPYTTRTLVNTPGLDLAFAKTRRTSMTLTGVYSQLKFGHKVAGEPLYNSSGLNGGLTIQYSLTRRTSLGMSLSHQDTTYQGGQVFGNRLRSQIESAFLTLASTLSPSVSVSVSGGPQYVRTIDATSAAGRIPAILLAAGGGGIRKEVRKTALEATFYRSSNTSGGVYTTAISTTASFSVRRRLMGRWEVGSQVGLARDDTSIFQLKNGRTDGLSAGADITRPVGRGSVFHISYFNMHQMSSGALPISYNFSRDQVSVGFDYQFKALPLGR
jgi:DNA-binding transcriptional regulator YdaS (Cro superfamily)